MKLNFDTHFRINHNYLDRETVVTSRHPCGSMVSRVGVTRGRCNLAMLDRAATKIRGTWRAESAPLPRARESRVRARVPRACVSAARVVHRAFWQSARGTRPSHCHALVARYRIFGRLYKCGSMNLEILLYPANAADLSPAPRSILFFRMPTRTTSRFSLTRRRGVLSGRFPLFLSRNLRGEIPRRFFRFAKNRAMYDAVEWIYDIKRRVRCNLIVFTYMSLLNFNRI